MNNFNKSFFTPNFSYTREMAEQRLISLGYKNFQFESSSHSHGASFYFVSENGSKIRVSDHTLTGNRAFDYIQIAIVDPKVLESPFSLRNKYLSGEITKAEYRKICKEKGFIFNP